MKGTLRRAKVSRTNAVISGGMGLLAGVLVTAASAAVRLFWLSALFPQPVVAWVMFVMFGAISLIEIPVMVYSLRKLSGSRKTGATRLALFANGAFVFFAAVYALPNLLLTGTGQIWMGLLLGGFSALRFGAGVVFLPGRQSELPTSNS